MKANSVSKQLIWRTGLILVLVDSAMALIVTYFLGNQMQQQQQLENVSAQQRIISSIEDSNRRNKTIEELLDINLYTATKAIVEALRGKKPAEIDRDDLQRLTDKWDLYGLSLFVREGDFFRIEQSSEHDEVGKTTEAWGDMWNGSYRQLMAGIPVSTREGLAKPHYWVGPASKSAWNDDYFIYGYYYDGTTDYLINPYVAAVNLFDHTMNATNRLIDDILADSPSLKSIAIVNIRPYLLERPANVDIPDRDKPIVAGEDKFPAAGDRETVRLLAENKAGEKAVENEAFAKETEPSMAVDHSLGGALVKKYILLPDNRALLLVIDTSEQARMKRSFIFLVVGMVSMALAFNMFMIRRIFRKRLTPIKQIGEFIDQIAVGNFSASLQVQAHNDLGWIAAQINVMAAKIKTSVDELENKVRERTDALQNLLNSTGQGFLSFADDLTILPEYSIECERMLGAPLAGRPIGDLLYPDGSEEHERDRSFTEELLVSILREKSPLQAEVLESLLPSEAVVNGIPLQLAFKRVRQADGSQRIMIILTDLGEKKQLERSMWIEQRKLQLVVRVVTRYADFRELIGSYQAFFEASVNRIMDADEPFSVKIMALLRNVHTLKGCFAHFDFVSAEERLHAFEDQLLAWKKRCAADRVLEAECKAWLRGLEWRQWLERDLATLRAVLGDDYVGRESHVGLAESKLASFERLLRRSLLPKEAEAMVRAFRKLRYRPFRDLLALYPEYVQRLARQQSKAVHPFAIEQGDTLVDHGRYAEFARSLIHVFRNMVDHGIESCSERASIGKDVHGTVVCKVARSSRRFIIEIANDGRPVDRTKLRQTVLANGIAAPEVFDALAPDEQLSFLFHEKFSSKDEVSLLSGRGIGLHVVQLAVHALQGSVHVSSAEDKTTFTFVIPIQS